VDPGATIRTFASGDRKKFLHPFTYVITLLGISVFLFSFTDVEFDINKEQRLKRQQRIEVLSKKEILSKGENINLKMDQFFENYGSDTDGFKKYSQYFVFFVFSIINLLVFKNLKFGLKKNAWYSFYTYGHLQILSIISFPLYFFISGNAYFFALIVGLLSFLISISYNVWTATQYYEITIGRAIKKYVFNLLISSSLFFLLGIITVLFTVLYIVNLA